MVFAAAASIGDTVGGRLPLHKLARGHHQRVWGHLWCRGGTEWTLCHQAWT